MSTMWYVAANRYLGNESEAVIERSVMLRFHGNKISEFLDKTSMINV